MCIRDRAVQIPLIPNEMASAIIADGCREDKDLAARLSADCGKTVLESSGGAASLPEDVRVFTVQNTADQVHIALPHYEFMDGVLQNAMEALDDEEIVAVSGGEIFATVVTAIGYVCVAIGVAFGGGALTVGACGLLGGLIVATAVTGVAAVVACGTSAGILGKAAREGRLELS